MTRILDPAELARRYRAEVRAEVAALGVRLRLAGILATTSTPSRTYAEYTRKGCEDVGVEFELREVPRLDAEGAIRRVNADSAVHGVFVYYPIFGTQQDAYLRDLVEPAKDVEGLHSFWARCLYDNRRYLDEAHTRKAILPCTPLAILKLLEEAGVGRSARQRPLAGVRACVFNRSEVVGRPLAAMLANDGAEVISFDLDGPLLFAAAPEEGAHTVRETPLDRAAALAQADVVITGVPHPSFPPVRAAELRPGVVCLNFSTLKNFADDVVGEGRASLFIPRVGPMTVTMALRNTVRLYRNAHS